MLLKVAHYKCHHAKEQKCHHLFGDFLILSVVVVVDVEVAVAVAVVSQQSESAPVKLHSWLIENEPGHFDTVRWSG